MSFAKLPDTVGFDEQRNVLVVSLSRTTNIYLPNFSGQPIAVRSADPAIATVVSDATLTAAQQKTAINDTSKGGAAGPAAPVLAWFPMNKIVVRGERIGETTLLASLPNGSEWQSPTKVVVVQNPNSRQADPTTVTPTLRQELQTMTMREAAVRIAQDQVNSSFMQQRIGDSRYDLPDWATSGDWCGAFVYWCYRMASQVKGKANPLGPINDVALSPQKAIGWALANPNLASLLRYQGPALFTWTKVTPPAQAAMVDAVPRTNLLAGDICLLRNDTKEKWQHVCMVYDPGDGDSFLTLDGNQGTPSMKMVVRDFNERVKSKEYTYAFVHLNLP